MHRNLYVRRAGLIVGVALAAVLAGGGCGGDDGVTPTPTPTPTWSNADIAWNAPYAQDPGFPSTLSYLVDGTTVLLQGTANAGGVKVQSGQVICTLPEAVRPPAGESAIVLCPTWGWPGGGDGQIGTAGIIILPDGQVIVRTLQQYDGQMQFVMFDGISFSKVSGSDGWTNSGITWSTPYAADGAYPSTLEYRRIGTLVQLRGFANAGGTHVTAGQIVGTLPAGYRPPSSGAAMLLAPTWGWPGVPNGYVGTAGVFVHSDGTIEVKTVQQYDGDQQFLNFDGLVFSTAESTDGWTDDGMVYTAPYTADGGYPSYMEFLKTGSLITLRSVANAGGVYVQAGQVVGTLPTGYRPPTVDSVMYLCPVWGWPAGYPNGYIDTAGVSIWPDGTIHVHTLAAYDGDLQFLGFEGKRFSTSWTVP